MRLLKPILAGMIIAGSPIAIVPAWAKCDPACTDGDICRYEAAGDKYYCKAPPKKPDSDDNAMRKGIGGKEANAPGSSLMSKPKQIQQK